MIIRPIFNITWNAFGLPQCDVYDDQGRLRGNIGSWGPGSQTSEIGAHAKPLRGRTASFSRYCGIDSIYGWLSDFDQLVGLSVPFPNTGIIWPDNALVMDICVILEWQCRFSLSNTSRAIVIFGQ